MSNEMVNFEKSYLLKCFELRQIIYQNKANKLISNFFSKFMLSKLFNLNESIINYIYTQKIKNKNCTEKVINFPLELQQDHVLIYIHNVKEIFSKIIVIAM